MKRLLFALCVLSVIAYSPPVFASESLITNEDILVDASSIRDIDISSEKGSTFTVEVPILSSVSSSIDWTAFKYGDLYWETSAKVYGDIDSNEQIRLEFDEDIIMSPDGGLKESVVWTGIMQPDSLFEDTYDSDELTDSRTWDSVACRIKPSLDTTAGLWRGYVTVKVFLEPREHILTAEQFKLYVEDDVNVESVTIPETININGVEYKVAGVGDKCFYDFTNLKDIYIGDVPRFRIVKAFGNSGQVSYNNDITIHGNCELYLGGYSDMNVSVKVDGCTLYLAQNPFNGWYGNPPTNSNSYHYNEIGQYDFEDIIGGQTIYGSWDDVTLNPNVTYFSGSAFSSCFINKLTVPTLKYADGSFWSLFYGCEVKEVVFENYFVGDSWFENCKSLEKVTLSDDVKYICQNAFANCTALTEIVIPESVEHIDPTAFSGTPFLENLKKGVKEVYINGIFICYGDAYEQGSYLEFPADVTYVSPDTVTSSVTHLAFEETDESFQFITGSTFPNVTTLDLTGRSLNGYTSYIHFPNVTKLIVGGKTTSWPEFVGMSNIQDIEFTEGFTSISDLCFNHVTSYNKSSFYIPSSVYMIGGYSTTKEYPYESTIYEGKYGSGWGNHVFYNFGVDGVFKEFIVAEDSPYYTTVDGILYTKDLQALVAVPRSATFDNNTFTLPNEVRRLGELSFSRNYNFQELVISDNLEIFQNTTDLKNYYNSMYCDSISCMNEGNSLSIATYQYCNLQRYGTRETNPNYIAIDGILYTKDLKELVAVPNHYQGVINIPEGCELIRENAFWLNYDGGYVHDGVTGISIPSTMKDIDANQLAYINRRWGSAISIADNNKAFTTWYDSVVKADTLDNVSDWNGSTGNVWFNSLTGFVGSDPNLAYARFNPIYIPEGVWEFEITDTTYGVPMYSIVAGNAKGYVTSLNSADVSLYYLHNKSYMAIEEGGAFLFICGRYVKSEDDTTSLGDITSEQANAIIKSFKATKVADIPITATISWNNINDKLSRSSNNARASFRAAYDINSTDTLVISLDANSGDYDFGVIGTDSNNNILADSGWINAGKSYTLSGCDKYVINFRYSNDSTTITYDDVIKLSDGLTITKLDNHKHEYSVVHTAEDCIYDGSNVYNCDCGHSYTETIYANGHTLVDNVCTVCGGFGELTIANEPGHYNEYGIFVNSWDELKSNGTLTVNGTTLTSVSTSLQGALIVDDSITTIDGNSFTDSKLSKVVLPNTITEIRYQAFSNCYDLREINLPEGLITVGEQAFWNCEALEELILPSTLTTVGREAFCFCRNVKTLTVPAQLNSFSYREFCWMNNLETVYLEHEEVPTFGNQLFSKWDGVKTTFYFKNQEVYDAFTSSLYESAYCIKSDNFDW